MGLLKVHRVLAANCCVRWRVFEQLRPRCASARPGRHRRLRGPPQTQAGLGPDKLARVYAGNGFSDEEKRELLPLVANITPPEDDDRWKASRWRGQRLATRLEGQQRQRWALPAVRRAPSPTLAAGNPPPAHWLRQPAGLQAWPGGPRAAARRLRLAQGASRQLASLQGGSAIRHCSHQLSLLSLA